MRYFFRILLKNKGSKKYLKLRIYKRNQMCDNRGRKTNGRK